jgi:hypothetical protein
MALNPGQVPPPPAPRRGIVVGSVWVLVVIALVVLVVVGIGYVTIVSVFDIPWYAAIPLSLVAGAGVVLYESTSSWKAWALAGVLVLLAAASALGWAIST